MRLLIILFFFISISTSTIAQALIGNPKILIVDEPTAGLDPGERNRFYDLISDVGEEVIVILSTHIVDDVRELCTQMAIMNNGQIVFNGSPLFTGDAGSGESEIRKWIIENDWLECIVSLPDQLFFNTGISTYVWIVTNNKSEHITPTPTGGVSST